MKLLYCKDFTGFYKNRNNIYDEGTRTFSIMLRPAFGFYIEINYGITILIGCFEINWLE